MTARNALAAEILESSAAGFASAANRLFEQRTAAAESGIAEPSSWIPHFRQRILELAAAVRVEDPDVFCGRVEWLRRACQARGTDEAPLQTSIESLRDALRDELPADMGEPVTAPVEQAVRSFGTPLSPSADYLDATTAEGQLSLEYLRLCFEGRTTAAVRLVAQAAADGTPLRALLLDVLVPAQKETGLLWHTGNLSVAEERLVSETTKQLLAILTDRYAPDVRGDRRMLAASVAGNAHDIAIRIIAMLYRLSGWECLFLGADVPPEEVAEAAATFNVDLVLLNATLSTQLRAIGRTIAGIRNAAPGAKVLIGGLALETSPELWKKFDADGYARDAVSALELGESLIAD